MGPRMRTAAVVIGLAMATLLLPGPVAARNPTPTAPMTVQFVAGRHTGYRFDADWNIIGTKTARLIRASSASATARRTVPGKGVHLRISNGTWAGYWVKESTLTYLRGITGQGTYSPPVTVSFPPGTYLGYRFDAGWRLSTTKRGVLASTSSAHAGKRAVINGRRYVAIIDGIWAGYWIPGDMKRPAAVACRAGNRVPAGTSQVISSVPGAGPEAALTFDMGGRLDPATAILDYLILERICVTVFPTGAMSQTTEGREVLAIVKAHPELFEAGNHTMHHCNLRDGGGGSPTSAYCPPPGTTPSSTFIKNELTSAASVIRTAIGRDPAPYWRPPYGIHDSRIRTAAAAVGYTKTFMWSVDTIDWRPVVPDGGPTAYDIAVKIRAGTSSGGIVLMHLGGYNTLDALPYAVAGLRLTGLQLTSLSDLLRTTE